MNIVALAGGVGGAKLVDGLAQCLTPDQLSVIVNTGDDFEHFGMKICPDLDTVCYTLAGLASEEKGWGRVNESWRALETIKQLGGPAWFNLGDSDLGLHLERTRRLRNGETLSQITKDFCNSLGIKYPILPMTDQLVATMVNTLEMGCLPFQEYFVKYQCKPHVTDFRFEGIEDCNPASGALILLEKADFIILCPSNPWVSIDPIIKINKIQNIIIKKRVIGISPIIGGQAVKGPAAKMYLEMGIKPSAIEVAKHYNGILNSIVIDHIDKNEAEKIRQIKIRPFITNIIMHNQADRARLAREVLQFCQQMMESERR